VPAYSYSDPNVLAFVVIPVLLVLALALGIAVASWRVGERAFATHRAITVLIVGGVWMFAWWMIASTGALRQWDVTPPPFAAVVIAVVAMALLIAYGGYGKRLAAGIPLWILVVIQGFRLPLELAMHSMYENGIMPGQMSYSGQNFDIITGVTALMIAPILRTGRVRGLAVVWNAMGFGLLVNVVVVAVLSTPAFQYFGPEAERLNTFVTYPPFVWLPTVMVTAALAGHLLIARALLSRAPR
jgi:hypothetical protein